VSKVPRNAFVKIALSLIDRPGIADRIEIDPQCIKELADSIREQGLLQPLILNAADGRYEIIAGDRRYCAVKSLGWTEVDAIVKELPPADIALARATENLQREDLTPVEEALLYARLNNDLGLSIPAIAKKVGKSAGVVQRRLTILDMSDAFRTALHHKLISITVAEELNLCPDESYKSYLLEMAIDHGITSAVARTWVNDYRKSLRTSSTGDVDGSPPRGVYDPEPVYRPCDLCRGPVDISDMVELRICKTCFAQLNSMLEKM